MTKAGLSVIAGDAPEVSVIIVSFNTRELTLRAIETLLANAGTISMEVLVWDNASHDGSAAAIRQRFPAVNVVAHHENIGFARGNNAAAEMARGEFILLLNPDTETHPDAVSTLVAFARENPQAGIWGGRTVFPDGSLNPTSCWNAISLWSLMCSALGLVSAFPKSCLFNPEAIGCWRRDSVRNVDIVTGCFFLIGQDLWRVLNGFDPDYFMYGEDADICLRAKALGYRPAITPAAQIMHIVGASTAQHHRKRTAVMKARATLIRRHWHPVRARLGIAIMWLNLAMRQVAARWAPAPWMSAPARQMHNCVWAERSRILRGYPGKASAKPDCTAAP